MSIRMTESEYCELRDNCGGVCRRCKERTDGCEPDARNYLCPSCEKKEVFGVEELLLMGEIQIVGDDDDA